MTGSASNFERITIDYYNQNAEGFVSRTLNLRLEHLYEPFLALLPPGAHILDAGCGSGRDSLYFKQHGYRVTAFDASEEMVQRAEQVIEQPVLHMRFDQVSFTQEFDAVWACASLLHVPKVEIDSVLSRLSRALLPGGVIYLSFRHGEREEVRDGRLFSDYTEHTLAQLISNHPDLALVHLWQKDDTRRAGIVWLEGLLRKTS
jgi:2-polyprenyl-3-methyl-5-hydroxy-6-metoxy-1,4-benzoquinol methylase